MNPADPAAPSPESDGEPKAPDSLSGALSFAAGARVAGALIAIGYLVGFVPGTVIAVLGGLGLVTLGRAIGSETKRVSLGAIAFGAISLAVAAGALRWGTSSLDAIRGVQAVLGPTVLVQPEEAAIGAGLAAGGGTLGLALWLGAHRPSGVLAFVWSCFEAVVGALVLATCFWGPAVAIPTGGESGELAKDVGGWALVVLAAAVPAVGLSLLSRRLPTVWSWVALSVAIAAAAAGVILVPTSVIR